MPEFLDYDPHTGITHWFDHDEMTNETRITYTQDIEPLIEYNKRLSNDSLTDRGIKEGWWLYAKIPAIVQVILKQKGIDITDPASTKRIVQEINTHYPVLKCTQKTDGGKLKEIYVPK